MTNAIGWCDETINPFTGCRFGCTCCYARRMAQRLSHIPGTPYHALRQEGQNPFTPTFHENVYDGLLCRISSRQKSQRIFVGSMDDVGTPTFRIRNHSGDLCSDACTMKTTDVLRAVRELALDTPHTFLLLTKQPRQLPLSPSVYVKDNLRRLAPAQPWPQEVYHGSSNDHHEDPRGHL